MAGCFGNHPEDRMRERELFRYLATQEDEDEIDEREMWRDMAIEAEIDRMKDERHVDD